MQDLNPAQAEAVAHTSGPLLVIAGAGSGKTRVITRKVGFLIKKRGLPARAIVALTFTNKAAREMKSRVGELVQGRAARGLRVSTFHTFGLNLLRRELKHAGLRPGFSLFDPQDGEALLKDRLAEAGLAEIAPAAALSRISHWKNDLIPPETAASAAEDDFEAALAALYRDYERSLHAYNAVDFDDLILRPVVLLREHTGVREAWQARIDHLLVDEYQDTNSAQYELIRLLVGERGAFTMVGDDDQSIYAWRGARPQNLARLKEDYPTLKVIMLEQNYRSSGRILKLANGLIAHNPHLFEKRLWSALGPGEPVRLLSCRDEAHEAERVIAEILHGHFAEQHHFGDYAILYRGNHQARVFEQALRTHRIPYFLSGGQSFFARSEVKDVMAYLRLLTNPDDDAAFLRVVNRPGRGLGATTLEALGGFAGAQRLSLLRACDAAGLGGPVKEPQRAELRAFSHWLEELRLRSRTEPIAAARALLKDCDYDGWLYQQSSSRAQGEKRMQNVDDLIAWLEALHKGERSEGNLRGAGLDDLTARLSLLDVLERQEEDAGGDRVHLMTLHAAKGLEFERVFLVGMEEDLLPHRASIEADTIEEERRLCYVGITRARRTLCLTLARQRRRYGETVSCEPSRFLAELPEGEVRRDNDPAAAADSRNRGKAHLDALKAMLGND
ncbi:UvrD-helicase domain-containing protein [Thiorhodovibrio frisius]|uniref:ATP-dependent DNA helicase Rep n=1 Tax=Thiorhodovibrio frisius TaxID=631362 RepID=H8Z171_9GAMM|nr:UvrD-helicase domain-containing protein [Thiorhodovibrio frisius]EIC21386.1 DNA/RNA helicase, superfamily I [Thiorhodovibrio frisius]WPL23972.1 ATP-dependent DNA helicase rep [Thiorhodovibrio frisius]